MSQPTPPPVDPNNIPPGHYDVGHVMHPVDWHNVQRDREQWLLKHSGNHQSGPTS